MIYRILSYVFIGLLITTPSIATEQLNEQQSLNSAKGMKKIVFSAYDSSSALYSEVDTALRLLQPADAYAIPVTITSDSKIVVSNKIMIAESNADQLYAKKVNEDGNYYLPDFTSAELKSLSFNGINKGIILGSSLYRHLIIAQEAAKKKGSPITISIEIKKAWLYKERGLDIKPALLKLLQDFDLSGDDLKVVIQSYDPNELEAIAKVQTNYGLNIPLILLIGNNDGKEAREDNFGSWQAYNYDWLFTGSGLRLLASYAHMLVIDESKIKSITNQEQMAKILSRGQQDGLDILIKDNDQDVEDILKSYNKEDQPGLIKGYYTKTPNRYIGKPNEVQPDSSAMQGQPISTIFSQLNISTAPDTRP